MNSNFPIPVNIGTPAEKTVTYAHFITRLAKPMGSEVENLLHGAVGVAGEAGELLDAVKKAWVYNKPLDRENVVEELGDICWYLQLIQNTLGITDEEIMSHNGRKLNKRYTDGYSDAAAQARADKALGE